MQTQPTQYYFNDYFMDPSQYYQEYFGYQPLAQELQPSVDLSSLSAYWFWDLQLQVDDDNWACDNLTHIKEKEWSPSKMDRHNVDETYLNKKMNELIEILSHLVWDQSMIVIHGKKKSERKANSKRRSDFIGVSRNGPNWQAMISIQKKKAYIGTYQSEKEAAISFDFYSIMIHGLDAKTNFSYSKDMIMNMIINYKSNGNVANLS